MFGRAELQEVLVVPFGAADDQLGARVEPQVPAALQQVHVVFTEPGLVVEEVPQAGAEPLVGQQAAAGRGRVVGQAEFFGERNLILAAAAADGQQPFAVDEPLLLGDRLRQELCAERPQDVAGHLGVLFDVVQGRPGLGHGALAQHLAAEEEIEPLFPHESAGQAEHQRVAVHAGVHGLAVAGPRVAQHHHVLGEDRQHGQRDPGQARGLARLGRGEKRGFEGDPLDLDPLLAQDQPRQRAVEPARAESQSPAFSTCLGHSTSLSVAVAALDRPPGFSYRCTSRVKAPRRSLIYVRNG